MVQDPGDQTNITIIKMYNAIFYSRHTHTPAVVSKLSAKKGKSSESIIPLSYQKKRGKNIGSMC